MEFEPGQTSPKAHNPDPLPYSIRFAPNSEVWRGNPHLIVSHGLSGLRLRHRKIQGSYFEAQEHHNEVNLILLYIYTIMQILKPNAKEIATEA